MEERQSRFRIGEVFAQLRLGTLVHGVGGETLIAVVDQCLEHRRWQAAFVAFLRGRKGVVEMRALFRPAGDLV
ncbi:hypothetical protein D3C71_2082970 [compost metagenome]